MITEIVLNKKYKVLGQEYTRTPLCIHNGWVFYEHNCYDDLSCSSSGVEEFKYDSEEIPESPEDWFSVISKLKGGNTRPSTSDFLYRSKADFLNYCGRKEAEFEFIKLRKVEL
jgi:hypothetical protein